MCLLAIYYRIATDAPLVVGANREEFYARGGEPPQILPGRVRAVGGRDPRAGGTWLGVNAHSLLVAVTNRPRSPVPDQPRSRGLLTRELLDCASSAEAVHRASRELDSGRYAGCNLLVADAERAVVIHAGEWLHVSPLPPGVHVLTSTHDVDDRTSRRVAHALDRLQQEPHTTADECLNALGRVCVDPAICLCGDDGGTVSSTLVALRPALQQSTYHHAQGPPDRTPYNDYSHLLRKLMES